MKIPVMENSFLIFYGKRYRLKTAEPMIQAP